MKNIISGNLCTVTNSADLMQDGHLKKFIGKECIIIKTCKSGLIMVALTSNNLIYGSVPKRNILLKEKIVSDFTFEIPGVTEDDRIMALVDDEIYGKCCYLIKEDVSDAGVVVAFDFIKTTEEDVPVERQQEIVQAIISHIVEMGNSLE